MKFRSILLFLFILIGSQSIKASTIVDNNKKTSYHSVTAKNGDGVFSLLRRYKLHKNSCDVQQFYKLNKLKKDENLIAGKTYILPVIIYHYNSISIRSSIKNDDWDTAIRIKEYNEFLTKNNIRKKTYRSSKILWVPHHEIHCNTMESKVAEKVIAKTTPKSNASKTNKTSENYEKLFGKKHGKFIKEDNSLKNQVFYVVSGHGGPDPGARCIECVSTMCEDEYAYDVSLRLVRNLMQHGAIVHMIIQDENDGIRDEEYLDCDKDETCMGKKIPLNQVKRLKQRTNSINKLHAKYKKQGVKSQKAIMIHVDSNSKNKKQDTYFYYYKQSKAGKLLAESIRNTFKKKYNKYQKGRGYKGSVKERGLYMLRNTHPTAVYVELANIRNKNDQKRLLLETNRQALANWLFEGFIK